MADKWLSRPRWQIILVFIVFLVLLGFTGYAIYCFVEHTNSDDHHQDDAPEFGPGTGQFKYASVATDSEVASQIGTDILARQRGNAVDAAVAAAFATHVMSVHSAGVGGGGFILLYDSESKEWHTVNFRGHAPSKAYPTMFAESDHLRYFGGLSIAVPGEVKGLFEVQSRFGKLPWRNVVTPTVKLCRDGFPLTKAVRDVIVIGSFMLPKQLFEPLAKPYLDENGNIRPVGSLIKLPKLAATYEIIADDPMSFYQGKLAEDILNDLREAGAIISEDDLRDYSVKWGKPSVLQLPGSLSVYSVPAPAAGPALNFVLNIMAGYDMSPQSVKSGSDIVLTYHRIIEAAKFAYAMVPELADPKFYNTSELQAQMSNRTFGAEIRSRISDTQTFAPDYYRYKSFIPDQTGTTHISVMDGQGSAVAITTSINQYFGSRVVGNRTNIVFNNLMEDFAPINGTPGSFPPSPKNQVEALKTPQSFMCPTIVWDNSRQAVRLVTGAAGSEKIVVTVAKNIMDLIWFGYDLPEAVSQARMFPKVSVEQSTLEVEQDFPEDIRRGLEEKGHKIGTYNGKSVSQAIHRKSGMLVAVSDIRKGGQPEGF